MINYGEKLGGLRFDGPIPRVCALCLHTATQRRIRASAVNPALSECFKALRISVIFFFFYFPIFFLFSYVNFLLFSLLSALLLFFFYPFHFSLLFFS